jgi:hypothetical protein
LKLSIPLKKRSLAGAHLFLLFGVVFLALALSSELSVPAYGEEAKKPPACVEYCYEPIPVPGEGSGSAGQSSGAGPGGSEDVAAAVAAGAISETERALGVLTSGGQGRGQGKDREGEEASEALRVGSPSTESGSATSAVWIALIVVLGLATIALVLVGVGRLRAGGLSRGDVLLRGLALVAGLGLVFLLSPGVSGASASKAPKSFFGMMSMTELSSEDGRRMARGGVSSYRLPVNWGIVQPQATSAFDWGALDPVIETMSRSRVRVLPFVYGTTGGLSLGPTSLPIQSSEQRRAWAGFLRAAIGRYGKSGTFWRENPDLPKLPIRTWQIWNEANFFYFTEPVVAADYFKLLKASHRVIKQEDADAKVMMAGLYGSPPNDPRRSMKSWQFLAKLYKLGAKKYFDSVALHPYSPNTTQLRLIIEKVRSTMNRYGGKRTPIDITEVGWGSDSRTGFGKGSTKGQAKQLTSAYNFMTKNRKKMGIRSAYWFAWQDVPRTIDTCNFCYSTGLFYAGSDLRPKPAWRAFVKVTGGRP